MYSTDQMKVGKIEFIEWSVLNEEDSPFTADMIVQYCGLMGSRTTVARMGLSITIQYNGLFIKRQWQMTAKK